jgi:transposase
MSYKIAGIDVHKKVLMVVVMDAHAPADEPERRRFATMPSDLRRLLSWLQEKEVKEAVMESTAQYWRSVWLELESRICVCSWHKRFPTVLHGVANTTSRTPNGWCGG